MSGVGVEVVEAAPFVEGYGDDPAQCEEAYYEVTEGAEIVVESSDRVPEPAFEMEVAGQQAERFDSSHYQRDDYGDGGDGHKDIPDNPFLFIFRAQSSWAQFGDRTLISYLQGVEFGTRIGGIPHAK